MRLKTVNLQLNQLRYEWEPLDSYTGSWDFSPQFCYRTLAGIVDSCGYGPKMTNQHRICRRASQIHLVAR